jgi:hypothetical protein
MNCPDRESAVMTKGTRAAVEVARQTGLDSDDPVLIQETNNTVVWLRPHPVVAKVGTRSASAETLVREHAAVSALSPKVHRLWRHWRV